MVVVADSSPLILLAKLDLLELLPQLYEEICIPKAVYDEVVEDGDDRAGAAAVQEAAWIRVSPSLLQDVLEAVGED